MSHYVSIVQMSLRRFAFILHDTEILETESIGGAGQKVWSVSVSEMLWRAGRIQALFVDGLHATVIIFLATSSISPQTFLRVLVSK